MYEVIVSFRINFDNGEFIDYPVGKRIELTRRESSGLFDQYNVEINEKYVKPVVGWIAYNGEGQPVGDNIPVEVKFIDYDGSIQKLEAFAKHINWNKETSIFAYKILEQPEVLDKNVETIRELLKTRAETGFKKYGVTTERNDLKSSEWCQHAIEELLDCAVYLTRLQDDLKMIEALSGVKK